MTELPDGGKSLIARYGSRQIEFILQRHDHDRLKIEVHPDQSVRVWAPFDRSDAEVCRRVKRKGGWILKQLDYFQQFQPLPPPKQYVSGESHYYLGRQYRLKVLKGKKAEVKLIGRFLKVWVPDKADTAKIAERVELWYRQHARRIFLQRSGSCFRKLHDPKLAFPEVKMRKMKQRWGSCSRPDAILLNPELIKAPLYCVEYVIMHELCHLKYQEHSPRFFRLLQRCMPDWQRRKQRLESAIL